MMRVARRIVFAALVVFGLVLATGPADAGTPPYQPEVLVKSNGTGKWIGNNVYHPSDVISTGQYTGVFADQGDKVVFKFRAGNDGPGRRRVLVSGPEGLTATTIRYKQGGQNVSAAVADGSYRTAKLRPGRFETFTMLVRIGPAVTNGSHFQMNVLVSGTDFVGDSDGGRFSIQIPA